MSYDIIVLFVYFLICLLIGVSRLGKIELKGEFVRYRGLGSIHLSAMLITTIVGAGSTLGISEQIYRHGLIFILIYFLCPVVWFYSASLLTKKISKYEDCLTLSEVIFKEYGETARYISAILNIVVSVGVTALQAIAIGKIFEYFFGIGGTAGMIVSFFVLTAYSVFGGSRSIVLNEIFQFAIFFLVIPIACTFYAQGLGDELLYQIPDNFMTLEVENIGVVKILVMVILLLTPSVDVAIMQKMLMAKNSKELFKSFRLTALMLFFILLFIFYAAYLVKISAPNIAPEYTFLYFANNLPVGLRGLMIAGLFAIIMSTGEAYLNAGVLTSVNDIIKPMFPKLSDKSQVTLLRIFTILLSILSVSIALSGINLKDISFTVDSIWGPILCIPTCAVLIGLKVNSRIFTINLYCTMILTFVALYITGEFNYVVEIFAMLGSVLGFLGSYLWYNYRNKKYTLRIKLPDLKFEKLTFNFEEAIENLRNSIWQDQPRYAVFGGFTLSLYFIFQYFVSKQDVGTVLIILMSIGYFLSGPLLMRDLFFTKKFQKKYLPFYWLFLATYCLPTIGTFCLYSSNGDDLLLINGLVLTSAVFCFMRSSRAIISIIVGSLFGFLIFVIAQKNFDLKVGTVPLIVAYVHLLIIVTMILFIRYHEKNNKEKIENLRALGGTIAHEVRNPLSSMSMLMGAASSIIQTAIDNSKLNNGVYTLSFHEHEYNMLNDMGKSMNAMTSQSNNTIENILLSIRTSINDNIADVVSVKDLLEEALSEYQLYNSMAKNIKLFIHDNFLIECNKIYLKHTIFNLIKNAYRHNGNDVLIKITCKKNTIKFKDYGKGIAKDIKPYIFDRFFTSGSGGSGLGLALCKMVMESINGTISCNSKEGEFTTFYLSFPSIDNDEL